MLVLSLMLRGNEQYAFLVKPTHLEDETAIMFFATVYIQDLAFLHSFLVFFLFILIPLRLTHLFSD